MLSFIGTFLGSTIGVSFVFVLFPHPPADHRHAGSTFPMNYRLTEFRFGVHNVGVQLVKRMTINAMGFLPIDGSWRPTVENGIPPRSDGLKMLRIHAVVSLAKVIYKKVFRDLSHKKFVAKPVSAVHLSCKLVPLTPIPVVRFGSSPDPTLTVFSYLS